MKQRKDKKDRVCPSESTEKEDRVCPSEFTLRHQHEDQSKVQRKQLKSPPTPESEAESGYSGLSFRSDWSKDVIIDFKSGQLSAVRSPVGSDSPLSVHSYPSLGSNRSTDIDLDFNNQRPTPPGSLRRTCEELLHQQEAFLRQQEVQHQQEVKNLQDALLRQQEVQRQQDIQLRQQEVKNLQKALLHQQEAFLRQQEAFLRQQEVQRQQEIQLRQQEVKNLQKALLHQKEVQHLQVQNLQEVICQKEIELQAERKARQEAQLEALEAKRELKLKRLVDQQPLNSGKNNSHKPKRKCPGSTRSSSGVEFFYSNCSSSEDKPEPPGSTPSLPDINISDFLRSTSEVVLEELIPSFSEVGWADYYR